MIKQWELIPGLADELLSIRRDSGSLIDSVLAEIGIIQSNILTKVSKSGDTMTGNLTGTTALMSGRVQASRFACGGIDDGLTGFMTYQTTGVFFAGANSGGVSTPNITAAIGSGFVQLGAASNGSTIRCQGQNTRWGNLSLGVGTSSSIDSNNFIFGFRSTDAFLSTPLALGRQGTSADSSLTHEGAWLVGEATDTLGLRRGTNSQRLNLYGTFTDPNNYRRLYISSTTAGAFTLGVEGIGTGSSGNTLTIANALGVSGNVTASSFISSSLTITGGSPSNIVSSNRITFSGSAAYIFYKTPSNNLFTLDPIGSGAAQFGGDIVAVAGTFSGALSVGGNITPTSSSAGSGRIEMVNQQYTASNVAINMPWGTGTQQGIYGSNGLVGFASAGTSYFEVNTSGLRVAGNRSIGLGGTIASPEVTLFSGSNVLEQRNGASAQILRIYNAFTDSFNYDRGFIRWLSNTFEIGTEIAGSYTTARSLVLVGQAGFSVQTNSSSRFSIGPSGQTIIASAFTTASGSNSCAIVGDFLTVSGQNALGHGGIPGVGGATVAATNSAGICGGGTQSGSDGSLAHGFTAISRIYSSRAFACHRFSTNGDVQGIEVVLRALTTNATPTILYASGTNRVTVPSGKVMHLMVNITGVKSDGSVVATYLRQVTIKNVGGTTSLVGTVNTIGVDQASGTSIAITADDGNDALQITATGITSETWRWEAIVYGSDLTFGT